MELPERSLVPMDIAMKEGITVLELFNLAMEAERRSERFYREMASKLRSRSLQGRPF